MFGIGLLLLASLFVLLLIFSSKIVPKGVPRVAYFVTMLGVLVIYPFAYKLSPTYAKFHELCSGTDRYHVLKARPASYIYIEAGFSSDCKSGPSFVAKHGYAGFDCSLRSRDETALYRYTKKASWSETCGLECFDAVRQDLPETNYRREYRYGFVDGDRSIVTDGYGVGRSSESREGAKLVFTDRLLVEDGVIAYGRDYVFLPYGDGWAKILGMASGSAPAQTCKPQFIPMDLRDAYPPQSKGASLEI
ncbi:MAG: hypothetical protein Q7K57_07040 [Burkholderiaceae bacterium]|nr:hypothetical protein [Burkholderiaceae bacterium]